MEGSNKGAPPVQKGDNQPTTKDHDFENQKKQSITMKRSFDEYQNDDQVDPSPMSDIDAKLSQQLSDLNSISQERTKKKIKITKFFVLKPSNHHHKSNNHQSLQTKTDHQSSHSNIPKPLHFKPLKLSSFSKSSKNQSLSSSSNHTNEDFPPKHSNFSKNNTLTKNNQNGAKNQSSSRFKKFKDRDIYFNDDKFILPCSKYSCYKKNLNSKKLSRWYLIQSILKEKIEDFEELEECILSVVDFYEKTSKCSILKNKNLNILKVYFEMFMSKEEREVFFGFYLKKMKDLVLEMGDVFSGRHEIDVLRKQFRGIVELNEKEVLCLMCGSFFCVYKRRKRFGMDLPSVNFYSLFSSYGTFQGKRYTKEDVINDTDVYLKINKLHCVFEYFRTMIDKIEAVQKENGSTSKERKIKFERRVLDKKIDWSKLNDTEKHAIKCDIHMDNYGSMEENHEYAQIDFANKTIGGGVLGRGAVQEEIRFLISTECIVSRVFVEDLDDNECLIISNIRRFCKYKGYGRTFEFNGRFDSVNGTEVIDPHLICIDAKDFSGNVRSQFTSANINREIDKCILGFNTFKKISIGNWGSGVFRGDRELKSLIMLIVLSMYNTPNITYYTYRDQKFLSDFQNITQLLKQKNCTISKLYKYMMDYRYQLVSSKKLPPTLFQYIQNDLLSKKNT